MLNYLNGTGLDCYNIDPVVPIPPIPPEPPVPGTMQGLIGTSDLADVFSWGVARHGRSNY